MTKSFYFQKLAELKTTHPDMSYSDRRAEASRLNKLQKLCPTEVPVSTGSSRPALSSVPKPGTGFVPSHEVPVSTGSSSQVAVKAPPKAALKKLPRKTVRHPGRKQRKVRKEISIPSFMDELKEPEMAEMPAAPPAKKHKFPVKMKKVPVQKVPPRKKPIIVSPLEVIRQQALENAREAHYKAQDELAKKLTKAAIKRHRRQKRDTKKAWLKELEARSKDIKERRRLAKVAKGLRAKRHVEPEVSTLPDVAPPVVEHPLASRMTAIKEGAKAKTVLKRISKPEKVFVPPKAPQQTETDAFQLLKLDAEYQRYIAAERDLGVELPPLTPKNRLLETMTPKQAFKYRKNEVDAAIRKAKAGSAPKRIETPIEYFDIDVEDPSKMTFLIPPEEMRDDTRLLPPPPLDDEPEMTEFDDPNDILAMLEEETTKEAAQDKNYNWHQQFARDLNYHNYIRRLGPKTPPKPRRKPGPVPKPKVQGPKRPRGRPRKHPKKPEGPTKPPMKPKKPTRPPMRRTESVMDLSLFPELEEKTQDPFVVYKERAQREYQRWVDYKKRYPNLPKPLNYEKLVAEHGPKIAFEMVQKQFADNLAWQQAKPTLVSRPRVARLRRLPRGRDFKPKVPSITEEVVPVGPTQRQLQMAAEAKKRISEMARKQKAEEQAAREKASPAEVLITDEARAREERRKQAEARRFGHKINKEMVRLEKARERFGASMPSVRIDKEAEVRRMGPELAFEYIQAIIDGAIEEAEENDAAVTLGMVTPQGPEPEYYDPYAEEEEEKAHELVSGREPFPMLEPVLVSGPQVHNPDWAPPAWQHRMYMPYDIRPEPAPRFQYHQTRLPRRGYYPDMPREDLNDPHLANVQPALYPRGYRQELAPMRDWYWSNNEMLFYNQVRDQQERQAEPEPDRNARNAYGKSISGLPSIQSTFRTTRRPAPPRRPPPPIPRMPPIHATAVTRKPKGSKRAKKGRQYKGMPKIG